MVIALVTSNKYKRGYRDSEILIKAFQAIGHEAQLVVWDNADVDWSTYDIVLIHTTWDYQDKFTAFIRWCRLVSKQTLLVNNLKTIEYNSTKSYLLHLQDEGITIPLTQIIHTGTSFKNTNSDEFISHQIIVKPIIDAGGEKTYKFNTFEEILNSKNLMLLSQKNDLLIQTFQEAIYEGEYSVVFIDGVPSHCVLKRPCNSEFRVQEEHGGITSVIELTDTIKDYCTGVIKLLPVLPLYLRIDFIDISSPMLMEIEMIEPDLFLRYSETAATVLAKAVVNYYEKNKQMTQ